MALKRIPARFLREALNIANRLAHAQNAPQVTLPHILYGVFERLQCHSFCILKLATPSLRLTGIVHHLERQFEVPKNLPDQNGATQSMIVQQALKNAHRRAKLQGRRIVLLEDLLTVLLESRWVMKLFFDRDADRDFLAQVRILCLNPQKNRSNKQCFAERPQHDTRRRNKKHLVRT